MGKTPIEWTDESSNPIAFRLKSNGKRGWACVRKSAGCRNCYSERRNKWLGTGLGYTVPNMDLVEPFLVEKEIRRLLHLREPRKIFICNMLDLFGEFIPREMLFTVFAVMAMCNTQTFQVLTKRADRMEAFLADPETPKELESYVEQISGENGWCPQDYDWPLKNLWMGVSVEDSSQLPRIEHLLRAPAAVRFVSCEPLLSEIDITTYLDYRCQCRHHMEAHQAVTSNSHDGCMMCDCPTFTPKARDLNWVVCGGETGSGARPAHLRWLRGLRDQCQNAGVAFHFKSWGEYIPKLQIADFFPEPVQAGDSLRLGWCARDEWMDAIRGVEWGCLDNDGKYFRETTTWNGRQDAEQDNYEISVYRVGRKNSGRLLDGRTWDEFPEVKNA